MRATAPLYTRSIDSLAFVACPNSPTRAENLAEKIHRTDDEGLLRISYEAMFGHN